MLDDSETLRGEFDTVLKRRKEGCYLYSLTGPLWNWHSSTKLRELGHGTISISQRRRGLGHPQLLFVKTVGNHAYRHRRCIRRDDNLNNSQCRERMVTTSRVQKRVSPDGYREENSKFLVHTHEITVSRSRNYGTKRQL